MEDGSYGEVGVSCESSVFVRACIQTVINAFHWDGMPRHYPSQGKTLPRDEEMVYKVTVST